jgi:shikimate kinase
MAAWSVDRNVVLIGMPGVGKSTVGVLLAKALSCSFIDTDVYIQAREGRRLQDIIDAEGLACFRDIEARHVLSLECRGYVIATGGSIVYSEPAMRHLKASGIVVHISLPLAPLLQRLTNLDSRGVVMAPGQTVASLFAERSPLYVRYADVTVGCLGLTHEQTVARIMAEIEDWRPPPR